KDSFDSIFTSEVFEHVTNVNETLLELNRVLKNRGKLLITTPFSFPEHEMPFDFRRFTKNGIVKLIEENGYKVDEVKTYGNLILVMFQLFILYIHDLLYTKNKYINLFINSLFIFPFTVIGIILSFLLPKNKSLYFGVILLATKK
ncbi:MAG: methyltransferase domain-containing protein, partial [Bacilli bacterium]|nr:methyltransferase domain-containing protein [Bacilli bacterium]